MEDMSAIVDFERRRNKEIVQELGFLPEDHRTEFETTLYGLSDSYLNEVSDTLKKRK